MQRKTTASKGVCSNARFRLLPSDAADTASPAFAHRRTSAVSGNAPTAADQAALVAKWGSGIVADRTQHYGRSKVKALPDIGANTRSWLEDVVGACQRETELSLLNLHPTGWDVVATGIQVKLAHL